jgi:hypothetical protein
VGFERVELAPGQRVTVEIEVSERDLSYWSEQVDGLGHARWEGGRNRPRLHGGRW